MKKSRSKKKATSDDESESFSRANNAFAAAMDEALRDEGDKSVHDDIFESIQNHDDAIAMAETPIKGDSTFGLADFPSSGRKHRTDAMGLPTVTELPDSSTSRPSIFKLSSVPAAIGKKWRSDRSQNSTSSNDRSVYSEANIDRPIPTRRLSRSHPSSWDVKPGSEGDSQVSKSSADSSFISIYDIKAERSLGGSTGGGTNNSFNMSVPVSGPSSSFAKRSASPGTSRAVGSSRPLIQNQISQRTDISSDSYVVPMPTMQFETRRGTLVRVALGILFFSASLTFTMLLGQGQIGKSVTYYLYNNFIIEDDRAMSNIPNEADAPNGAHLFPTIERLESLHSPNTKGVRIIHTPKVWNENGSIEISIGLEPHEMTEEHYIELVWLKDVKQDKIVLAKEFRPNDESPPILKAKVPHGVTLQPYTFCNVHLLWKGEPFPVA